MPRSVPDRPAGIDPSLDIPLYQQIAEAIRRRIASGELAPGDALEPLREAADRWGVNLHTVRHAYTSLARHGLIETGRGPRGTRVSARSRPPGRDRGPADLDEQIQRLVDGAARAGVSPRDLVERVRQRASGMADGKAPVFVVECSAWQCRAHIEQLRGQFDVDARACVLGRDDPPPEGAVILATYFHYNDLRRLWPERLREIQFVTIAPEAALLDACVKNERAERLVVFEDDEPTAENIAADIRAMPGAQRWRIEARATADVETSIADLTEDEIALMPPRVWSRLTAKLCRREDVQEIVYELDREEIRAIGTRAQWRTA